MQVTDWGNYPQIEAQVQGFDEKQELQAILESTPTTIARGMGRCYGDSALNTHMSSTLRFNRILAFDPQTGVICCEAGVTLEEILDTFVPRGWFLPVTPGTKFISVGGAVAADVHGKNHHKEGSFSQHLLAMDVMLDDGAIVTCSKDNQADLFWNTCGGMGLTGIILTATFVLKRIESAYIRQESTQAPNLETIMGLFEESEDWTYTVAWIDCLAKGKDLGRSIMMRGEHAQVGDLASAQQRQTPLILKPKHKLTVPFHFPEFALNTWSVRCFNFLYYHKHPQGLFHSIVDYDTFFYPLDAIHHWNRIYGKRGFTQYQLVLPRESSREGIPKILKAIADKGLGSFLAVLKLFGKQEGVLSFPMEGYTLAMDFSIQPGLFSFLDELDRIVLDHGGRLYLAKDVRMTQETFMQSYPKAKEFLEQIKTFNHDFKFRSLQSDRIGVTL